MYSLQLDLKKFEGDKIEKYAAIRYYGKSIKEIEDGLKDNYNNILKEINL